MDKLIKDLGSLPADEMQKVVNSKNLATGALFKWCTSTLMCYDIYKNVEPLRKNVEKLQKELDEGLQVLAELEDKKIEPANEKVDDFQKELERDLQMEQELLNLI